MCRCPLRLTCLGLCLDPQARTWIRLQDKDILTCTQEHRLHKWRPLKDYLYLDLLRPFFLLPISTDTLQAISTNLWRAQAQFWGQRSLTSNGLHSGINPSSSTIMSCRAGSSTTSTLTLVGTKPCSVRWIVRLRQRRRRRTLTFWILTHGILTSLTPKKLCDRQQEDCQNITLPHLLFSILRMSILRRLCSLLKLQSCLALSHSIHHLLWGQFRAFKLTYTLHLFLIF